MKLSAQLPGWVTDAALYPASLGAVIATSNGFWLLEQASGSAATLQRLMQTSCLSVHYLEKGKYITAGEDGVHLWRNLQFDPVTLWQGKAWLQQVLVMSDTQILMAVENQVILISSTEIKKISVILPGAINSIALSPDGKSLAVAYSGGIKTGAVSSDDITMLHNLAEYGGYRSVKFSPKGKYLVAGLQEKRLQCWDLNSFQSFNLTGYLARVESFSFMAGAQVLVTSGTDCVVMWDLDQMAGGACLPEELLLNYGNCSLVECHPILPLFAAAFNESDVVIFCCHVRKIIFSCSDNTSPISTLRWSEDGNFLFYGTEQGDVRLTKLPVFV